MREKLEQVTSHGLFGFYYDSHAKFLFVARSQSTLYAIRNLVVQTGLPVRRIVSSNDCSSRST